MKSFNDEIKAIEKSGKELFWLGRASDDQVRHLEELLGYELPTSFKEFLREYGGGGVIESEISGIEDNDASLDSGGTVYGDTLTAREDYDLPSNLAVIYFKEDEVCWCLDLSSLDDKGECNVVSYSLFAYKVDRKIASSFLEFFEDYLNQKS